MRHLFPTAWKQAKKLAWKIISNRYIEAKFPAKFVAWKRSFDHRKMNEKLSAKAGSSGLILSRLCDAFGITTRKDGSLRRCVTCPQTGS